MKKQNFKKKSSLFLPPSTCQMKVKKTLTSTPLPLNNKKKKKKNQGAPFPPVHPFPVP
jgi:hypothetical protein